LPSEATPVRQLILLNLSFIIVAAFHFCIRGTAGPRLSMLSEQKRRLSYPGVMRVCARGEKHMPKALRSPGDETMIGICAMIGPRRRDGSLM